LARISHRRVVERLEARAGIEPTIKGFADLPLATWVPRHHPVTASEVTLRGPAFRTLHDFEKIAAIGNGIGLLRHAGAEEKLLPLI
jgi:hypothetical protein